MNELQKELQDLKAKVAELESRIAAEPVKLWQPKGGDWWIKGTGQVGESFTTDGPRLFGMERETVEQAQRAAIEMRRFNRLLALRDELCADKDVNWLNDKEEKYSLYFSHEIGRWELDWNDTNESIQPYFTTLESAQKACDMLNSGEVKL